MRKLYLVRHAKSSWKHEGVKDMDRPLKGSGIRDAYSTSEWLRGQKENPDLIIASPATRAMHTALIFARNLNYHFDKIQIQPGVYGASSQDLRELIRAVDDHYQSVMLFGHNPTITDFVNKCIDHRIDNVPTTGVACLKFDVESWKDIDNSAELLFFDYPKRRR